MAPEAAPTGLEGRPSGTAAPPGGGGATVPVATEKRPPVPPGGHNAPVPLSSSREVANNGNLTPQDFVDFLERELRRMTVRQTPDGNRGAAFRESDGALCWTAQIRRYPVYDEDRDNFEAFVISFTRTCMSYGVPEDRYMQELRPQLSGTLAEVAAWMPTEDRNDFSKFLDLARETLGLTPERMRARFRAITREPGASYCDLSFAIQTGMTNWLRAAKASTVEEIRFQFELEHFLDQLPPETRSYVLLNDPQTLREAATAADRFIDAGGEVPPCPSAGDLRRSKRVARFSPRRPLREAGGPAPAPEPRPRGTQGHKGSRKCFACGERGHLKSSCRNRNPAGRFQQ